MVIQIVIETVNKVDIKQLFKELES